MKQKDKVLIIVIAFVSGVASIMLSTMVIGGPKNRTQQVEVVDPIVADFPEPDKTYFNENSKNPTQLIRIGNNTNPTPFNAD